MTKQTLHVNPPMRKQRRTVTEEPSWSGQLENCWGRGLNLFYKHISKVVQERLQSWSTALPRRDEEQIMTKQTPHLKPQTHKQTSPAILAPILTHWIEWTPPHCILEDSNSNFRYVRLCDLDIFREKWLNNFVNNGVPDQTSRLSWSALFVNFVNHR